MLLNVMLIKMYILSFNKGKISRISINSINFRCHSSNPISSSLPPNSLFDTHFRKTN